MKCTTILFSENPKVPKWKRKVMVEENSANPKCFFPLMTHSDLLCATIDGAEMVMSEKKAYVNIDWFIGFLRESKDKERNQAADILEKRKKNWVKFTQEEIVKDEAAKSRDLRWIKEE